MNVKLIRKGKKTHFHTGAGSVTAIIEANCSVVILPSNDRRIKFLKGKPWNFVEVVIKKVTPIKESASVPVKKASVPVKKASVPMKKPSIIPEKKPVTKKDTYKRGGKKKSIK